MLKTVIAELPGAQVLIMAAAVADFRPAAPPARKIKKDDGIPQIQLERTADILKEVANYRTAYGWPKITVGFAAESEKLIENAQAKLQSKRLDMIVANDILARDSGFSVDTNRISLFYLDGRCESLPLMSKDEVAEQIMVRVAALLEDQPA
jgi:phosphopantothenoylcysteine decarboxylase / phosphopantothenate---cysteine ligase